MRRYNKCYRHDPVWITCRYGGHCARCGTALKRGERAFYFPTGGSTYCEAQSCGPVEARRVASEIADEETNAVLHVR